MFKNIVIAVISLTAVYMQGAAYCQQGIENQHVNIIAGKVIKMDVEGGVIDVKTDIGNMVFYFLAQTNLFRSAHHISIVEISIGDPVVIHYVHSSGKNNVISLVDTQPASY